MEKEEIKYYTRSNGEKIPMNQVHTTHLLNSMKQKYENIFTSTNKDEFASRSKEIDDIKEEIHLRMNQFHDSLGDNDGE